MLAERAGEAVVADDAAPAQRSGGAAGGGGWIGRVGKKLVMAVAGAFLASKARYIGDQLSGRSPRRRSANATRTAAGTAGSTLGYEIGKAFAGEMGGRIGGGVPGRGTEERRGGKGG